MAVVLWAACFIQVDPIEIEAKKVTPEVRAWLHKLDEMRLEAFRAAAEALKAELQPEARVSLVAADAIDPDADRIARDDFLAMETSTPSPGVARIRIHVEYLVNGMMIPEETFRHEMVHAVMRLDLGDRYRDLPRWLREGIAVHLAGQRPGKLIYHLMLSRFAKDPERLVDGLEDADHDLTDYVEDALGIEYFLSQGKTGALAGLEARLRDGTPYREAIAAIAGQTWEEFLNGARDHALAEVRRSVSAHAAELEAYREILEAPTKSEKGGRDFLRRFPRSPFRSPVLYYLARSSGDAGLKLFEEFIRTTSAGNGMTGLIDDARWRRAEIFERRGQKPEAMAELETLVRWHVDSGRLDDALYRLGFLVHERDAMRGVRVLRQAVASFPKHRDAERARRLVEAD